MNLDLLGWTSAFKQSFDNLGKTDLIPARISSEHKGSYTLMTEVGELWGKVSGSYRYATKHRVDFPAVGDWAAIQVYSTDSTAIIHTLLPRKTMISRKLVGANTEEQVLAANVDFVFIVTGLDRNFNLRRIERYMTLVWEGGAQPIIVLNKVDLVKNSDELSRIKDEVESIALGIPVHFISALNKDYLAELNSYFSCNKTVALLGSSGVGKSMPTNQLLGESRQKTFDTRESDSKGRHTTTRRQLFLLPSGGMLIDTPGMRELQLWLDEDSLDASFSDIDTLAKNCRFIDCAHDSEPDCAVKDAIELGTLDAKRLLNYNKMRAELKYLAKRQAETSWETRLEDRKFGRVCNKMLREKRAMRLKNYDR